MSARTTLWAVSDLHAAVTANAERIDSIRPADPSDWLIVAGDVAERMMIDLLQNVAPASGRRHQIGTVDVAAAIRGAGRRLRVQTELTQDRKLMFVHSDNLFLLICSARRSVVLFCISF